jgi:hypothetical protein
MEGLKKKNLFGSMVVQEIELNHSKTSKERDFAS